MRLIRILSAKPYFIPDKGEVAAEMYVFIDAPGAEAHHMVSVNSKRERVVREGEGNGRRGDYVCCQPRRTSYHRRVKLLLRCMY